MGTRGIMGFRVDGTDRLIYNHWDSGPSWLGGNVVKFLRGCDLDAVREQVRALRDVGGTEPTAEDRKQFAHLTDNRVSTGADWYALIRQTQGDPAATLECGVFEGSNSFMADSLFCEYAYVINLDANVFEVYRGFQDRSHSQGRYAEMEDGGSDGYKPVALVGAFPIEDIPEDWARRAFPDEEE